jgi:hypothetical protein
MPFKAGDIAKYVHPPEEGEEQKSFFSYHYRREYLDGKIALILSVSSYDDLEKDDYCCFINGYKMWINEALLHEAKINENKKNNI